MSDSTDFHDLTIETIFVDAASHQIRLTAVDAHSPTAAKLVAEFKDVSVYCLSGDLFGMIVFELEERDPLELYRQFATELQTTFAANSGHARWVAAEVEAARHIAAQGLRGFELSSSTGGAAAIWCREFQKWAEQKSGLTSA